MKNLTLQEYEAEAKSLVFDVMACGDIVCVDCGEAGKFVIMEEPEYQVMREAMAGLLALTTSREIPDKMKDVILGYLKKSE